MSTSLSGVLTALATPFTPNGQIDEKALRRLVDRSIDGGVDGVVACGSTGEFAAMSGAERRSSSKPSSTRPPTALPWLHKPVR